jgi:predicted dehydrogenase
MGDKKRFVQVGLGSRSEMYSIALVEVFCDNNELVGLCDSNAGRVQQRVQWARERGVEVPGYVADGPVDPADEYGSLRFEQFDRMISETRPDTVIVTTKDCYHDEYICRAMELGCDVITEKPMTTDAHKCQRIIDTQHRTGRQCKVTFNYRYSPVRTQVKDLLMSGIIGEIYSVDFHWLLDTRHGADYYRRWHRNKANSGGLMVHKSTHHFDMMNWWLSAVPTRVYASGARKFYAPKTAERYGLHARGERCLDCPEAQRCSFYLNMRDISSLNEMYLENEQFDGYFRDQCVFSDQIDIEDSMNLVVNYDTGVMMSYSLNSFMPWEGYEVSFNGSKGRLEHKCMETVYISGDGSVPGALRSDGTYIRIYPHFQPAYSVDIWESKGGHGGGDFLMLRDIFEPSPEPDKYVRAADYRAGAYSILTGIAANQSMRSGQAINVADLVQGIQSPDYTSMPTGEEPV